MDIQKRKKTSVLSFVLFVVIFGGLLLAATFFDLKINDILTSSSLSAHTYLTNDAFGASFEAVGDSAHYIMFALAFSILFAYFTRFLKGAFRYILGFAMIACDMAAYIVWMNSVFDYLKEHLTLRPDYELHEGAYLYVIAAFIAAVLTALSLLAVKNFSDEDVRKLFRFSIATLVVCIIPTVIVNLGVKGYVGRIRYRAMNMYPDDERVGFAAFTRWFEVRGQWLSKDEMLTLFGTKDALKSFPSGHTCSAGVSYSLIMLIDALGIEKKRTKVILWICPVIYTGTVAVSRMVCGAHFMSDVLVGGTLSFVTMILAREFIVNRRANLKAVFNSNKKA